MVAAPPLSIKRCLKASYVRPTIFAIAASSGAGPIPHLSSPVPQWRRLLARPRPNFRTNDDQMIRRRVRSYDPSSHTKSRSGGVIVFHEPDWGCVRSFPPAPTYDRCCHWIIETFRRAGTDTIMAGYRRAAVTAEGRWPGEKLSPSKVCRTRIGTGVAT